uniref:Uncharacterized protein n=1 Tax=Noccaea caerulescens TaxID=107243 RepID=A0A1J3GW23_NOCCA
MKLVYLIAATLMLVFVSGEISTKSSPAPAPDLPVDAADSPPIPAPSPKAGSPSPSESPIEYSSPPEPETKYSPSPAPSDSPSISPPLPSDDHPSLSSPPSPSPSPEASDVNHSSDITGVEEKKPSGGDGMSGGTKAGVAFGTIAAVCVVGVAGFVYKKRQDNIRRSRYGYAAREIL